MISEEKIKKRIEEKLGSKIKSFSSLSGGCISDAFKISTENGTSFFLKYNPSASNDMFLRKQMD
ncbi:MAG: fructosamine kinase family protein [Ignavibacteriaceae bacterium]|nr:fructosamine kinase family protein [Ignavibacteriaceae bacterium]